MRMLFALIAAIWQLSFCAAASAATITFVSGAVSINRGEGFHKTTAGTEGNPGDTVMVGPASSAEITYLKPMFGKGWAAFRFYDRRRQSL